MARENPDHTLQTTALVNDAYLRLIDQKRTNWQNRAQFFGIAAQLMRRILVDHARSHAYAKRGGGAIQVSLNEGAVLSPQRAADVLALDEALNQLATVDPRKCRIVELRYFGGFRAKRQYQSPIYIAVLYGQLGDNDKAFEWLEKAYKERSSSIFSIKVNPRFIPLRSDPRFNSLLLQMGLTP